jgi:hypothetical protein
VEFLIVLLLGIIAFFCIRQMASQKAVHESRVDDEVQARERLITLVRYQLNRWANEPAFLSSSTLTPDVVREHMKTIGLVTYETCVLTTKPELWFKRAHEWLMTNSKANAELAGQVVRATHTTYVKEALAEKLGEEQFQKMQRRLRGYYEYVDAKMPMFKPSGQIDKWWQDVDWWYDEYQSEARVLGLIFTYDFKEDGENRHVPRHRWIRKQVAERGTQKYDAICEEAKNRFPESWQ